MRVWVDRGGSARRGSEVGTRSSRYAYTRSPIADHPHPTCRERLVLLLGEARGHFARLVEELERGDAEGVDREANARFAVAIGQGEQRSLGAIAAEEHPPRREWLTVRGREQTL